MHKLLLVGLVALSGCSVYGPGKIAAIDAAVQRGDCPGAYAMVNQTNNSAKYFNSAYVASNCERNESKAIGFLTYGARMGNQESIDRLLRIGQPVPPQDLKQDSDQALTGLLLLQAAQPRSTTTTCNSSAWAGGVRTTCN